MVNDCAREVSICVVACAINYVDPVGHMRIFMCDVSIKLPSVNELFQAFIKYENSDTAFFDHLVDID